MPKGLSNKSFVIKVIIVKCGYFLSNSYDYRKTFLALLIMKSVSTRSGFSVIENVSDKLMKNIDGFESDTTCGMIWMPKGLSKQVVYEGNHCE